MVLILFFFDFLFVENCLKCDAIHGFTVWLTTGSNPLDINQFQSNFKFSDTLSKKI